MFTALAKKIKTWKQEKENEIKRQMQNKIEYIEYYEWCLNYASKWKKFYMKNYNSKI